MKKLLLTLIILFFGINLFAGYVPIYPAKIPEKDKQMLHIQAFSKTVYDEIEIRQKHFFIYYDYTFTTFFTAGINAKYHMIDFILPTGVVEKYGMGDPFIYFRWMFLKNKYITLGLKNDIDFPLGNKDFTEDKITYTNTFISDMNLRYLFLSLSGGHYTTNDSNVIFSHITLTRMLSKKWIFSIDYYFENNITKKEKVKYFTIGNVVILDSVKLKFEYLINQDFEKEKGFFALRFMKYF